MACALGRGVAGMGCRLDLLGRHTAGLRCDQEQLTRFLVDGLAVDELVVDELAVCRFAVGGLAGRRAWSSGGLFASLRTPAIPPPAHAQPPHPSFPRPPNPLNLTSTARQIFSASRQTGSRARQR